MSPRHNLSFCACKTAWFASSLYGFQPSSVFFSSCKAASLWPHLQVCMGSRPHLWFLHANQQLLDQNCMSLWVLELTCDFCIQNSDLWNRITNLYGSQTSPVDLCRQYSVIINRITCPCGSQSLSVIFACKTAYSGLELQVSVGPWLHLWFSACTTACLASELLVSMGPSPHVWFLDAKQRLLDQKYKSLWVPHLTCPFVHAK